MVGARQEIPEKKQKEPDKNPIEKKMTLLEELLETDIKVNEKYKLSKRKKSQFLMMKEIKKNKISIEKKFRIEMADSTLGD